MSAGGAPDASAPGSVRITVDLGARSYPVVVAPDAGAALAARVAQLDCSGAVVVTDESVGALHEARATGPLADAGHPDAPVIRVPAGEASKSLDAAGRVLEAMRRAGLDRRGLVVALGGGVVGDLAGFAAAIYLRGVDVIQVPTTLLAQVDSSVGGKTAVNLPAGKNLVGAFHQPRGVFVSTEVLASLPAGEFTSAFGEIVKYGLISETGLFEGLERDPAPALARDPRALTQVIATCLRAKAAVVAADEREGGARAILNVGHTVGHALEALTGYVRYRHGDAVAIGNVYEARLSAVLGLASDDLAGRVEALERRLGLPVDPDPFDPDAALVAMRGDKKAVGGRLRFALPCAVGRSEIVDDVSPETVRRVLAAG